MTTQSNKRRFWILVPAILALVVLSGRLQAQAPTTPLSFAFAFSTFALDDTTSMLEFDYHFTDRGLTYAPVDGRPMGRLMVRVLLFDAFGKPIYGDAWTSSSTPPEDGAEPNSLLGTKSFAVPPGTYAAQVYYEDLADGSRRDSADITVTVRSFAGKRLGLSDVLVIGDFDESTDKSNAFYRDGLVLYPNVLSTVTPPLLVLNTYLEVYNADHSPTSQFDIIYGIADSSGRLIYQREERRNRPISPAIAEMHTIMLDSLPSGDYFLLVRAFNSLHRASTDSTMVVKAFTIVNPDIDALIASAGVGRQSVDVIGIDPLYAGLTEAELDLEFASSKMLAKSGEIDLWASLSGDSAKARFLSDFWQRRDLTPETVAIESRDDFFRRRAAADALYREPLVEHGWQSDRGRILLQYGKPDQVDRQYMEKNRKPFEVWKYSKDNLEFAFVDKSQQGRFLLVHSSAPGETSNENWETMYATIHQYLDQ